MYLREVLALLLALTLSFPGTPSVVGNVTGSESATVRGTTLTPGSTIFSGDTIEVGPKGAARIALDGGAQVQVSGNSQIRLAKTSDTVQMTIDRGFAAFLSTEKSRVEALLGDATIRPAGDTAAIGVINVRSPESAVIAAQKGTLLIRTAHDSRTVTLREGDGAEVKLASQDPQQQDQTGDKNRKKKAAAAIPGGQSWSAGKVVIIAVILGGVATAIGFLLGQNEAELTQQQKCNAVSPFRCP